MKRVIGKESKSVESTRLCMILHFLNNIFRFIRFEKMEHSHANKSIIFSIEAMIENISLIIFYTKITDQCIGLESGKRQIGSRHSITHLC